MMAIYEFVVKLNDSVSINHRKFKTKPITELCQSQASYKLVEKLIHVYEKWTWRLRQEHLHVQLELFFISYLIS